MWVFLKGAFLSIVEKPRQPLNTLTVRARAAGDIERVFPRAKVTQTGGTDYAYRANVSRELVAETIADEIRTLDYSNFKAQVTEPDRHEAYLDVWRTMLRFQQQRLTPPPPRRRVVRR